MFWKFHLFHFLIFLVSSEKAESWTWASYLEEQKATAAPLNLFQEVSYSFTCYLYGALTFCCQTTYLFYNHWFFSLREYDSCFLVPDFYGCCIVGTSFYLRDSFHNTYVFLKFQSQAKLRKEKANINGNVNQKRKIIMNLGKRKCILGYGYNMVVF